MKRLTWIWLSGFLFTVNCFGYQVIRVTNPIDTVRDRQTVSVDMNRISGFGTVKPAIYNNVLKKYIACQVIDMDGDGTNDELVFQADFKALQTIDFDIIEPNAANEIQVYNGAAAYFVGQRKDDFAWENEKIAFRMYGQALQQETYPCSGIDVWVKKVERPVVPLLYKKGAAYYHTDNPLGIDFFDVGKTLGCGGLGVWYEGKLLQSENYTDYKIIANGPIRVVFELKYKPWDIGNGRKVGEIKRITLDKGSNFNRIESIFDDDVADVEFAVGIGKCQREGTEIYGIMNEYLGYWPNRHKQFGRVACGVVLSSESMTNKKAQDEDNYMLLAMAKNNKVVYYAGAVWDAAAGFDSEKKWMEFIRKTYKIVNNPLKVEIKESFVKKKY